MITIKPTILEIATPEAPSSLARYVRFCKIDENGDSNCYHSYDRNNFDVS
jgi:hypothetical protein